MTVTQMRPAAARRRSPELGLLLAGLLTAGMALYHFALPFLWGWGSALGEVPMLRWALFMLNASFSYLLLAGGVASVALALRPDERDRTGRWVLVAMLGYWLFNAVYQLAAPMPMPQRLVPLRWCLFGFAVAVALFYAAALVPGARATQAPTSPARPGTLAG